MNEFKRPIRIIQLLAVALVVQTVWSVVNNLPDYFPANFRADFLLGREAYFFGAYQWAFYAHIVAGPLTLLAGTVLLSDKLRSRYPIAHRTLGRVQVLLVLFVVAPSGLWMARYAQTGLVAGVGLAVLAVLTAWTAALGWRRALQRRFDAHRAWMLRCFALLCSVVVLRVIGGLSEVLGLDGTYPAACWLSWLLPLAAVECWLTSRASRPALRPQS